MGAYGLWKPGVAGSIPARLTDNEERRSRESRSRDIRLAVEGWCPVRTDIPELLGSIPRATTDCRRQK